ncbi:Dot/Icm secretion system protein IcmQ [Legionella jordanis]|nr:Dot/Icm secretion system protein IcmQ [Legionella jordanis]AAX56189.1 IcmQ [Legionella jordanis]RMX05575.1 Dot/Icm secretion system protein IcmQ [Legionella jordanis]RMX20958.1 Dot/Icm secretion system protein IcmQ [Legionella jordanis]HAT8713638.1 Dot/Icm secretion system protein IcmQ [Legionella jordanis]
MKDRLTEEQTQAILQALDEAIAKGPWEESNFLRVIGKNLREIRQNFANQLGLSNQHEVQSKNADAQNQKERTGQQEVYISLYSMDGNTLQTWERILANLPRQMISRPIYENEQDVINHIKSKTNRVNEAYVAAYVSKSDILEVAADKISRDKFGRPLLSLKDRSLNLDNITRFVHMSGTYHYTKGRLIKNTTSGEG